MLIVLHGGDGDDDPSWSWWWWSWWWSFMVMMMIMMILHGEGADLARKDWQKSSLLQTSGHRLKIISCISLSRDLAKKVISKSMMLLLTRLFLFLSLFSWKNRSSSLKIVVTQDIHLSLKPCNWVKLTILATLFLHLAEQRGVSTSYIEWKAEKLTWKNLGFEVPWMEFTWYLFWSFL